MVEAEEIESF